MILLFVQEFTMDNANMIQLLAVLRHAPIDQGAFDHVVTMLVRHFDPHFPKVRTVEL